MSAAPIVVVGESTAGCAAARELRALGHDGEVVMIGADPDGSYSRPPLSKHVLDSDDGASSRWDLSDLHITELCSAASRLDAVGKIVSLTDGTEVEGPVALTGNPVDGIVLPDRTVLKADVVVSCVGEVPATDWLDGTGIADRFGVGIGADCSTSVADVFAAGDITYFRDPSTDPRRGPFWSNAVAQGRVAAASVLGLPARCAPVDEYFWTEMFGLSIKVVGPLPLVGEPEILDGGVDDGSALLRWTHPDGRKTLVAYGIRMSVGKLRALARAEQEQA